MAAHLLLESLVFGYRGIPLAKPLTLAVDSGCAVAFVGPNGCGKSALVRTILGLVPPLSGRLILDGTNVLGMAPDRLVRDFSIGYIPTGGGVFLGLTVAENLRLAMWKTAGTKMRESMIDTVLHRAPYSRLQGFFDRHTADLSGGERMLLALARLSLTPKKMVVLDEPSAGLDDAAKAELLSTLKDIKGRASLVLIEHARQFIDAIADSIFVFDTTAELTTVRRAV